MPNKYGKSRIQPTEKDYQRNVENVDGRLGSTPEQSSTARNEQDKISYTDSAWRDPVGEESKNREQGNTGEVLRQLREIQQEHLEYVDSHKERLEARLHENEKHRHTINQKMERLEALITQLLDDEQLQE